MPVYSVEGKLGTGKTLFCVWRAQDALYAGRRVASNVDFDLSKLAPRLKANYVRLPDKPSPFDLEAIGHGNPESYDEDRNGVLILDELGTWLNSRTFQDKSRAGVLDWLIHARKLGWDVYLIVQDSNMIDKQVRESLIELQVRCMRGDKIRIPIVGALLSSIYKPLGYLPRFHWATARIGYGQNAVIAERWYYKGTNLYAAYDTRQVFKADYPHGAHCVLPPKLPDTRPGFVRRGLDALARVVGLRVRAAPRGPRCPPVPKPRAMQLIAALPDPAARIAWAKRYHAFIDKQTVGIPARF